MKLKRGQKLCKSCNQINGARAYTCKHCNTDFESAKLKKAGKIPKQKKPKKFEEIDWRALNLGDTIKVVGRSGNYYVNSEGEKQYLTDAGVYTVQRHDTNGMVVHSHDGGFGYIYMGPEMASDTIPNMFRSPHKILKVNAPVRPCA
jgi:hypothetical protein